jgi:hypothetical protein
MARFLSAAAAFLLLRILIFIPILIFLSFSIYADDLEVIFEKVSSAKSVELAYLTGREDHLLGVICEQVAIEETRARFPAPAFRVEANIVYFIPYKDPEDITATEAFKKKKPSLQMRKLKRRQEKRVVLLGDLDIVVVRNSDQKVVAIAEMKCRENLSLGFEKASYQKTKFFNQLELENEMKFTGGMTRDQFSASTPFVLVSQKGGRLTGFDFEIDLDMNDLRELRKRVIKKFADLE